MGNADSRMNFRNAVIELTSKKKRMEPINESFWDQFWAPENVNNVGDVFSLIPSSEIRSLREDSPNNLATLCYKAVERLMQAAEHSCHSTKEQQKVINCVRLLIRILPFIFEDPDWRGYFWSAIPADNPVDRRDTLPLARALVGALADLLFCPDFTVSPNKKAPETPDDLDVVDSCEHIWEAGVGFAQKPHHSPQHDFHRAEILKLLLVCFSEVIYVAPSVDGSLHQNRWIELFTSADNRHVLPLFTSMLNMVFAYDPVGFGLPYNYWLFGDSREPLVQVCLQLLIVCLDHDVLNDNDKTGQRTASSDVEVVHRNYHAMLLLIVFIQPGYHENFFINYLGRIHREEDFSFILKGFTRLLSNPLQTTYLPNSAKKITFHQELLVLFWKCCEYNQKFMYYVLKTSDVLEILVPVLFHLNDSRNDQSRVGLIHMGVFILLLLSGERNFGVRLNKPYTLRVPMDIQLFTGTHADLLIIVFHKLITTGNQRLQSLFDCLLTIIVNVSPYLKSVSMVAANKLAHLLEAFSTPWFLYSSISNHHLVFFLLEVFNNIIQYQFDGNSNLIYTIIRKRQVLYQLVNLPADQVSIAKSMVGKRAKNVKNVPESSIEEARERMEDAQPAQRANAPTGTLNPSLAVTPEVEKMTEKSTSHLQIGRINNEESQQNDTIIIEEKQRPDGTDDENAVWWTPTQEWVESWKPKLPLQTLMRLLQVLVPQVEKICIDNLSGIHICIRGLTDESEILKFLQHGTLVGLLPVPHPILIRKYQANAGTNLWFRTYLWGIIYLRNTDPPIWYDTDVKLFEIQRI